MNPLTRLKQRLHRLEDDERAVSPVIGFVLIFALIMIVFTLYQTNVVPAQNSKVEFHQSQTVQKQMSQLNDAIQQVSTSGAPQSMTIATGVQYPSRALAINPGNPAGTLSTTTTRTVDFSGLSGSSGYWKGGRSFDTHMITYRPNYNEMQQETRYTLENGMMVRDYRPDDPSNDPVLGSGASVVSDNGKQINLVLVSGDYQRSKLTSSVSVTPVSTSTKSVHLTADTANSSIEIPTTLSQSTWRNEIVNGMSRIDSVSVSGGVATLHLQKGKEYAVRLTDVSLGGSGSSSLMYLKSEDGRIDRTAAVDIPETFTVSAHDQFGNPYAGATIDANTNGSGAFTRSTGSTVDNVATGDNGHATFTYTPNTADAGETISVDLRLDGGSGGSGLGSVSYNLTIPSPANDTTGASVGVGDIDNGYTTGVITKSVTNEKEKVILEFKNIGNKSMTAKQVRVNGFLQKSSHSTPTPIVSYNGTDVQVNGNVKSLNSSSEYTVPINGTRTVPLDFGTRIDKGGFLIVSVQYIYDSSKTDTATYAIAVA